jgi:hypothetical protein
VVEVDEDAQGVQAIKDFEDENIVERLIREALLILAVLSPGLQLDSSASPMGMSSSKSIIGRETIIPQQNPMSLSPSKDESCEQKEGNGSSFEERFVRIADIPRAKRRSRGRTIYENEDSGCDMPRKGIRRDVTAWEDIRESEECIEVRNTKKEKPAMYYLLYNLCLCVVVGWDPKWLIGRLLAARVVSL